MVNSVSFFAFILPDSTSRLFFLKKGPNVLDTFLHVLYNHSNYFLYFTKCYDNLELQLSSILVKSCFGTFVCLGIIGNTQQAAIYGFV